MPEPKLADALSIRTHLELLTEGKRGVEIRAIGGLLPVRVVGDSVRKRGAEVGFFTDLDLAATTAQRLSDGGAGAVYVTLNEIAPEIFARGEGKMVRGGQATQDKDILRFRNLLLDFDPKRASGISSSDAEHELAIAKAYEVREELGSIGWPDPLYLADSGNGAHLVYRVNLETNERNRKLVRQVLAAAAGFWGDDQVEIDVSVWNPARITKVIGTVSRKGDDTEQRPHRVSCYLEVCEDPDTVKAAPVSALTNVTQRHDAALGKRGREKKLSEGSEVDDLWRAMEGAGLAPLQARTREYGVTIGTRCWKREEDNEGETRPGFVVVSNEGKIRAGCRHATCTADVTTLLSHCGLSQSHGIPGATNIDPFATSPEDDVVAQVNALGLTIVFLPTGQCYTVTNRDSKHPTLRMKPDSARDYVGSRVEYIESERGLIHPLTVWLRSPDRREAFSYTYDPRLEFGEIDEKRNALNLWRGFAYEAKRSKLGAQLYKAWREHLLKHMCGGREEIGDYLWKLLAWKVQNPTTIPMVMPVALGNPGDGKGVAFLPIVNLFGEHGLHTESPLLGARFNDSLEGKAIIFHDEADHLADPKVMRAMKARVTESRGTYEAKGHSLYQAPSFPLHIAASNHPRIRIDPNDRRLLVLETKTPRGGIEWFEGKGIRELVADDHLERPESIAFHQHLLHEALKADLSGFRPNPPPGTDERAEKILESAELSVLQAWVLGVLESRRLPGVAGDQETVGGVEIESMMDGATWNGRRDLVASVGGRAMHRAYEGWAQERYGKEQWSRGLPGRTFSGFAKGFLAMVGGSSKPKKVRGKTESLWHLPTLEEARRHANAYLGVDRDRDWGD